MSTYDLNARLKSRSTTQTKNTTSEMALDDVARVKVLSPGRKVFKRFIRNRLAVFGSITLIILFAFSFLGPLVYPYGQKQIFYTFEIQNVNYALAKQNTTYNGYDVDTSIELERTVVNSMNSSIMKMQENNLDSMLIPGEPYGYQIDKIADGVYTLSALDLQSIATVGEASVEIGTYDSIKKTISFTSTEVAGLAEEAAKSIKGKDGSFTFNGVEYSYTRGAAKSYVLTAVMDGVNLTAQDPGKGFTEAVQKAIQAGSTSFEFNGKTYTFVQKGNNTNVYLAGEPNTAKVYTCLTVDTLVTGQQVSNAFKSAVLMALKDSSNGAFEADDVSYTVRNEDGAFVIYDADGNMFAELDTFTVRRYTGEDSMDFDLKEAIAANIMQMNEEGSKTITFEHRLPSQGENGEYVYDENGNLLYSNAEIQITQRNTGEYVINCDQKNYVIDRYAPPSFAHPLGTDGDGFDVMARIMYGGRISLMVGFVVIIIEVILGIIMGGIAGYYGGWVDNLIMRLVDVFYCLPMLPIMIIIGAMMDAARMDTYLRLMVMMAALGLMGWASVARLVRGQILMLREQEFMVATEATGIRVRDRIFRHLIPNVMPQLIVIATMGIGGVILTESTLSFLGLGVKHPLATWGTIINSVSSASAMAHYAFIWIPVGLLISLTVVAFNFVGDGLRDAYDPKSKK
ncbi:MAG: ABC transporter permease [Coriobacteriales bacterium]|nr:ABC transporter permease [Coriobacteriales bacterium]